MIIIQVSSGEKINVNPYCCPQLSEINSPKSFLVISSLVICKESFPATSTDEFDRDDASTPAHSRSMQHHWQIQKSTKTPMEMVWKWIVMNALMRNAQHFDNEYDKKWQEMTRDDLGDDLGDDFRRWQEMARKPLIHQNHCKN